ncbi:MAG: AMP-binding protein [Pseudomonadota bacterium]|nr:AMP-binding protein [Pseudomonadota bacterium]
MSGPKFQDTVTGMLASSAALTNGAGVIYDGCMTTYSELDVLSRRAAAGFAAQGIGPGDRVAFWLPNTPAYLVLYFACVRLGAIAVAVNTRFRSGEVEDVLGRTGAKALIMWPGFRGIDFTGILEEVDGAAIDRLELAILYSEDDTVQSAVSGIDRTLSYDELFDVGIHTADAAKPELGCNTFTTSGTTKAPKFVLHANESMGVHAAEVALDFGYIDPSTVVQQDMPLCGVFGLTGALAAIAAARPLILTASFDAELTAGLMAQHKVTHFDGSDEMIDRLLRATDHDEIFERIGFAGYAIFNSYLDDIVERAERRGLRAVGLWGMSEMQALVTRRNRDDPAEIRKKGGGRLVSPRAAARVRDPGTGEICAEGIAGELEIKGPSRMLEYLDDAVSTAETLTDDGFVRTGDLCQMEPGGGFEYLTRMGDVLRLGGFLVSPAEIEAEIQAYPTVAGVQVVSASMAGTDRPVAFVIAETGTTIEEGPVQAHCAARLAKYKVPAKVVPLDSFPVTESANGVKIQRAKLRQMAIDLVTMD